MTADEVRAEEAELKDAFRAAIQTFTDRTGFSVTRVDVEMIETTQFDDTRSEYICGDVRVWIRP